jgi:rRNA-processing protein FCF1
MSAVYVHVGEVCVIHLTTYYDSCYNPIVQAMKYCVATLDTELHTLHLLHVFHETSNRQADKL